MTKECVDCGEVEAAHKMWPAGREGWICTPCSVVRSAEDYGDESWWEDEE